MKWTKIDMNENEACCVGQRDTLRLPTRHVAFGNAAGLVQKPDQNCRQYFLASSSQQPTVALKKSAV